MRVHKSKHDMTTGEAVIENSVRTMHVNRQLRQCRAVRLGGLGLRPERDKFGAVCWAASELGPTKLRRDTKAQKHPPPTATGIQTAATSGRWAASCWVGGWRRPQIKMSTGIVSDSRGEFTC